MAILDINDYKYPLPEQRIALYPLTNRDESKLLIYQKGKVKHERFTALSKYLPTNSLLLFNNTKVIPARLHFKKDTGAVIEIFLLHAVLPSTLLLETMNAAGTCTWKCTIGNLKRWKDETTLHHTSVNLEAHLQNREEGIVTFKWNSQYTFAEVISKAGETPLPPYLKRKADADDRLRYQTIYSQNEGAVAAPTAGLHFTPTIFDDLEKNKIKKDFLTLHVSAGTFQPIKTEDASAHVMHQEQIIITKENLVNLLRPDQFIIPVGTTSMRTLESLYWFGVKLVEDPKASFVITQHDPYTLPSSLTMIEAIEQVLNYMQSANINSLAGETAIFIKPGYKFKVCHGLITNFHQPASTLILLVAAFIGKDWRKVYDEALQNDYRFLSYGDSSLLLPDLTP